MLLHTVTFSASFFVLAQIMLLHYTMMPHEPDDHAARKSRVRGFAAMQLVTLYNMTINILGVGLKANLKYMNKTYVGLQECQLTGFSSGGASFIGS